jgi:osmotically-inducible protein OsmY
MKWGWWPVCLAAGGCAPSGPRDIDGVADDKELETKIVAMIEGDTAEPGLKYRRIKVECAQGVVVLSGTVKTEQERERAAYIADFRGVREVVNRLRVESGP